MSNPDEKAHLDEIRLSLPGLATYGRVARLAITGLASRLGFSYDDIEDLRIAIGEVCSVMLDGSGARLTLRCTVDPDMLRIDAQREPAAGPLVIGELSHQILRAVASDVEADLVGGRITIDKRRRA